MKTTIIGSDSILGRALENVCAEYKPVSILSRDINISSKKELFSVLKKTKPKLVINCIDYYTVEENKESFKSLVDVHFKGVANMAKYCAENDSILVHFSSDRVFRSNIDAMFELNMPGSENDSTEPLDLYGEHKLQSELVIKKNIGSKGRFYIIRIPWCYAPNGDNLLLDLYKIAKKNEIIDAVSDIDESPVSAENAAKFTKYLVRSEKPSGTYHLAYEKESVTRAEIFEMMRMALGMTFNIQRVSAKYLNINRITRTKLASIKKTDFKLPNLKKDLIDCIKQIPEYEISKNILEQI